MKTGPEDAKWLSASGSPADPQVVCGSRSLVRLPIIIWLAIRAGSRPHLDLAVHLSGKPTAQGALKTKVWDEAVIPKRQVD